MNYLNDPLLLIQGHFIVTRKAKPAVKKILSHVHNGEILLLHPTSATNAAILGDLIKELKNEGYEFRTLDTFGM